MLNLPIYTTLFVVTCTTCNNVYCTKLDDIPLLDCAICGQEVHRPCFLEQFGAVDIQMDKSSLQKLYNPWNIKGLYYICQVCESSTIPQKDQGRKKSAKKSVEINFISDAEPNSVNYETVNN